MIVVLSLSDMSHNSDLNVTLEGDDEIEVENSVESAGEFALWAKPAFGSAIFVYLYRITWIRR